MIRINGKPLESAAYAPEAERAVMPEPEKKPREAVKDHAYEDDGNTERESNNAASSRADKPKPSKKSTPG